MDLIFARANIQLNDQKFWILALSMKSKNFSLKIICEDKLTIYYETRLYT